MSFTYKFVIDNISDDAKIISGYIITKLLDSDLKEMRYSDYSVNKQNILELPVNQDITFNYNKKCLMVKIIQNPKPYGLSYNIKKYEEMHILKRFYQYQVVLLKGKFFYEVCHILNTFLYLM